MLAFPLFCIPSGGESTPPTVVTPSADYELPEPTAGTVVGQKLEYHITPTPDPINLTLAAGILIPTDSAVTFPRVLTVDKTYIVQLRWLGAAWGLTTLIGGY